MGLQTSDGTAAVEDILISASWGSEQRIRLSSTQTPYPQNL